MESLRLDEPNDSAQLDVAYDVTVCAAHTHGPLAHGFLVGESMPCFLGLSPTTPFVNRGRLHAILAWLVPRCSSLLIVEGLYASRWNLVVIRNLSESQAIEQVIKDIQRLRRRVDDIVSGLPNASVEFLDWEHELSSQRYIEIEAAVIRYAAAHAEFKSLLHSTTRGYVSKVYPTKVHQLLPSQWDTLSRYVVEELAMFLHLYHLGYRTEVYPGSDLEIVEATCAGRFQGFPIPCAERTHVSLELRSR